MYFPNLCFPEKSFQEKRGEAKFHLSFHVVLMVKKALIRLIFQQNQSTTISEHQFTWFYKCCLSVEAIVSPSMTTWEAFCNILIHKL